MSMALTLYDDRFARRQAHTAPMVPEVRAYPYGDLTVIINGEIRTWLVIEPNVLHMPGDAGGPARVAWMLNEERYPNQCFVCVGCPFYGISYYNGRGSNYCAHPLYIECFGVPQSISYQHGASPDCPMLGLHHPRSQSIYRAIEKARYIFWEYYRDEDNRRRGTNAYREGFLPIDPYRPRRPRIECQP